MRLGWWRGWPHPLALLLTTLAAIAVLMVRGPSCGHDFDFHLVSWLEVAHGWRTGLVYPHWLASANYGAGEPRFVFYPPASWLLGALLGVVFGWSAAPVLYTAACLLGAGIAMQRLARTWLTPMASTAAACLYMANPYMLFVADERTAYGELLAATLTPCLLAFAIRTRPLVTALAAPLAGLWLMNAPAGVMACYALLWIAMLRVALHREWCAACRIAAGAALGVAMAGFYLVPAAYQQRWVEISRAIGPGMRIADSFLFGRTGEPFHDQVLHTASLIACLLLGICLAALLMWRDALRRRELLWLASFLPLVLLLLLPLSAPVWKLAPHLAYLQFPWRWLLLLAPIAALFTAGALARRLRPTVVAACTVCLCVASIALSSRAFFQVCDDEDAVSAQVALLHAGTGEEGTDEYTPRDDDNPEIDRQLPQVRLLTTAGGEEPDSSKTENPVWQRDVKAERSATVTIHTWSPERHDITIDTAIGGYAVLRLLDYPAWLVKRNGLPVVSRPHREDGLLTVPIPAGRSHIEVGWRMTGDVWAGRILTLFGLCVWLLLWKHERAA